MSPSHSVLTSWSQGGYPEWARGSEKLAEEREESGGGRRGQDDREKAGGREGTGGMEGTGMREGTVRREGGYKRDGGNKREEGTGREGAGEESQYFRSVRVPADGTSACLLK